MLSSPSRSPLISKSKAGKNNNANAASSDAASPSKVNPEFSAEPAMEGSHKAEVPMTPTSVSKINLISEADD